MPPQEMQLDSQKDFIYDFYIVQKSSLDQLLVALQERLAAPVKRRTVERRLKKWGIQKQGRLRDTSELRQSLKEAFYRKAIRGDAELFEEMQSQGHQVSHRGVFQLRYDLMGPLRFPSELQEAADLLAGALMQPSIEGAAADYGREHRLVHMRQKGYNITRYVLYGNRRLSHVPKL